MKVILGLGNPGAKYEATRHNVGWWVLDHLADVWRFDGGWRQDGDSLTVTGVVGTHKVRLVKPQTYMNLSGAALRPFLRRAFWTPAADLLVVVDDVALPVGRYRLRAQGSAGGHNGLKSLQHTIGDMNYSRLRIGVGPDDPARIGDLADYVLGRFEPTERDAIVGLMPRFADAAELWLADGIVRAMNVHNGS